MAQKTKRLSKVAREFNVGISTIVDYLKGQGKDIDENPNTKIDEEIYALLEKEFEADQSAKKKSRRVSARREKRETISIKDSDKKEEPAPEPEPEAKPKEESAPEPEPTPEPEPKVETKPEPAPEPEPEKPESKEEEKKEEAPSKGPKVLGKIDLPETKKPAKKEAAKKEAEKKEEPKKEEKAPQAKEEAKPEAPKEEKKEEAKPEPEESKKIETKYEKLSGPKVVGKIELPKEVKREKKSDTDDDGKRKRKRVRKVDVQKQARQQDRGGARGGARGGKKGPAQDKTQVTREQIEKEIKETMARMSGKGKSKAAKYRRSKRDDRRERREMEELEAQEQETVLKLTEFVTVSELATMMNVSPTDVISACMSLGIFASINQRLDEETINIICEEFGYTTEFVSAEISEAITEEEDKEEDLIERPPIVTVMGHVDHGKTSLLDYVRKANVIGGEAGGITQHIGAYSVTLDDGRKITFLDTPGHEAFTAMRARGAQVTDIAIIVIAADDSVMPQTKEAINHAQAAGVPMVFAFNKIDKPGANADKIREELSAMNILVEDWGGKFQCQEISAKKGQNIDDLLEKVLLEAELLELKANPEKNAVGTVVESTLDKGRGYVTTLLIEGGTLRVGDMVLAGQYFGKVKAMTNERGKPVKEAGPATPVSILGFNGAPSAGDKFHVLEDEREVKQIASKREQLQREQGIRTQRHITLDEIGRRLEIGDFKELNIIVKGDVDGSIEALSDSLLKLSTEQIQVNIIHKAVGQITESDVLLATASDAIIVGFQVRPSPNARRLAEQESIDIRLYSVIYRAIEEIESAMEGMLGPRFEEQIIGTAEIRETFKISKVGTIAGCFVQEGVIKRNAGVRLIRDGVVVYTGELGSLKRFKDDVKEVKKGYECGLNIEKYNDIKVGDLVEAFEQVEVAQKLK